MSKKNKNFVNVVYSTNPNFEYQSADESSAETLVPNQQKLYVSIDRKQRGGKEVTLVEGFIGLESDLIDLGKFLKGKFGVGGTVKDNEILIQGSFRDKVFDLLVKEGYSQTKKKGA
jgi:translation initiation factor 1